MYGIVLSAANTPAPLAPRPSHSKKTITTTLQPTCHRYINRLLPPSKCNDGQVLGHGILAVAGCLVQGQVSLPCFVLST